MEDREIVKLFWERSPQAVDALAEAYGPDLRALTRRNRSWAWNYGRQLPFTFRCEGQFAWGNLQLHLQVDGGIVRHAQAFSDAMDWEIAPALEKGLANCPFSLPALCQVVADCCPAQGAELCQMLTEQEI